MSLATSPASWLAGEIVAASKMNAEVRDALIGLQAPWDFWTPTLSGFTLGNGAIAAAYFRQGKLVHFRFRFVAGSSSGFSGTFAISLPVSMGSGHDAFDAIGPVAYWDSSLGTSGRAAGTAIVSSPGTLVFVIDGFTSLATSTTPFTWTTGDTLTVSGTYEAA